MLQKLVCALGAVESTLVAGEPGWVGRAEEMDEGAGLRARWHRCALRSILSHKRHHRCALLFCSSLVDFWAQGCKIANIESCLEDSDLKGRAYAFLKRAL